MTAEVVASLPSGGGVRDLGPALTAGVVSGDEAVWLQQIIAGGMVAPIGSLLALTDDSPIERIRAAAQTWLDAGKAVLLRPLVREFAAAQRYELRAGVLPAIEKREEVGAQAERLWDAVRVPDVRAGSSEVWVRLVAVDGSLGGWAASADPHEGDPDVLTISTYAGRTSEWRIDRKTMQVRGAGSGELGRVIAADAADLADRAQLILGRPIEVEWALCDGRAIPVSLRPLRFHPTFTHGVFRRVALVSSDEGTTAPLAIDALDRALSREDVHAVEPSVIRIYARAYRRMEGVSASRPLHRDAASITRAASTVTRVFSDFAAPLAAARTFERSLGRRLRSLDSVDLGRLTNPELIVALRDREALVVEALMLLDRGREATLACLSALSAVVGPLPRESYHALGAIRPTKPRRRAREQLGALAEDIVRELGELRAFSELPPPLRRRWLAVKDEVGELRPLGIDVRPQPFAYDEETFSNALSIALRHEDRVVVRERADAVRRLRVTARGRPFGRTREALVSALTAMLGRVSAAKGETAEGLAEAYVRLRRAACEAGRRLVDEAVLDRPDDGLYLRLPEIEDALLGEPGAYASRVRLRREDDARWANYESPRRILGRGDRSSAER